MVHVPYKGSGQLTPDLISGRVSMMFNSVAPFAGFIKDGKLRALAVTRHTDAVPLAQPDIAERLAKLGLERASASAGELDALVRRDADPTSS